MTLSEKRKDNASGQNTRLVRTLSRTSRQGEEYRKDIATIETDLPPGMDVPEAFDRLEATLEAHLKIGNALAEVKPPPQSKPTQKVESQSNQQLSLSPPSDSLFAPFKPGHRAGWCKLDQASQTFQEALRKRPVTVEGFVYRLSGNDGRLIARNPLKD